MVTKTMIEEIGDYMVTLGYKVNTKPQEKLLPNGQEFVITMEDYNVEPETNVTYIATTIGAISFTVTTPTQIATIVEDLIRKIETNFGMKNAFTFQTPNVTVLGLMYGVDLYFSYRTIVNTFS
jgi:hypothetical protein